MELLAAPAAIAVFTEPGVFFFHQLTAKLPLCARRSFECLGNQAQDPSRQQAPKEGPWVCVDVRKQTTATEEDSGETRVLVSLAGLLV